MRYGVEHKARTRERILAAAARRFRVHGYRGVGVDGVMSAAGLTPGGFYAHFRSKQALLTEALALTLAQTRTLLLGGLDHLSGPAWMRAVVGRYLSRSHRDHPDAGCPVPALASEIAREGRAPRQALEEYLQALVGELAPHTPAAPGLPPEDRVLATIALCAGALSLSRAVNDPQLSDRILRAARRLAVPETADSAASERS